MNKVTRTSLKKHLKSLRLWDGECREPFESGVDEAVALLWPAVDLLQWQFDQQIKTYTVGSSTVFPESEQLLVMKIGSVLNNIDREIKNA